MGPDPLIPALREVALFADLGDDALAQVARRAVRRTYPRGRILFRDGEACRGAYVVLTGSIEVYRASSDGRVQVIHLAGAGEAVAEVPLLDGGPYPASARTAAPSELLFLSRDDFQGLYRNNPEIADAVIHDLGRRLRQMVRLVDTLSLRDVPQRVATLILSRARREGVLEPGGALDLGRTQSEMASQLGTTREGVARALGRLAEDGVIRYDGPRVEIVDPARLEAAAGPG